MDEIILKHQQMQEMVMLNRGGDIIHPETTGRVLERLLFNNTF